MAGKQSAGRQAKQWQARAGWYGEGQAKHWQGVGIGMWDPSTKARAPVDQEETHGFNASSHVCDEFELCLIKPRPRP
eukprot:1158723-Pelagomonas_calceolata.AAC.8